MSITTDYSTKLSDGEIITCHLGDVTLLDTDVIVNSANSTLLGGNGVDMAVHRRGGPIIREECQKIRNLPQYLHGFPVGEAAITSGGNLKAKYVIHTVGPKYHHDPKPEERLRQCYTNSLSLSEEYKLASIGFPAISTGAYCYPLEKASPIALDCVSKYLMNSKGSINHVIFSLFTQEEFDVFLKAQKEYELHQGFEL